jgi:hypothetical protein
MKARKAINSIGNAVKAALDRVDRLPQVFGINRMCLADGYPDSSGDTYSDNPYTDCPYDDYSDYTDYSDKSA